MISVEVNLFCLFFILLFFILFFVKFLVSLFKNIGFLEEYKNQRQTNLENSGETQNILISVVYTCDNQISTIVKQLKNISNLFDEKYKEGQLEFILFVDQRHKDFNEIKLLPKVFPNIQFFYDEKNSGIKFLIASLHAKGKYIVDSHFVNDELESIRTDLNSQLHKHYISLIDGKQKKLSAISKSMLPYLQRIHFVNITLVEEFLYICKKCGIQITKIKTEENYSNIGFFEGLGRKIAILFVKFLYSTNAWKLEIETQTNTKSKIHKE
ncbi:hypothetical protein TRFO_22753 [Tritrichomonas foetus]|uniref:Glycosyltransferase 2-like domain-containing protein n=1 Tax=Tritrichomonas foetus TaxID=1144522 RepID=A0A1J4KBR6_9EUKA|nr:hypothetical protein TRFO_22753 [Tritrichomonas foetus]|eukprot:OHT08667.1 hypothetical protein TRFO_22753 [Tritrichomonas foetus]